MVYLKLSVKNIERSIDFYTNKLQLFQLLGDRRLICKNVDLAIDMEVSDDISLVKFGFNLEQVPIVNRLEKHNVEHRVESNLAGTHIYACDPDGHQLWITGHDLV